MPLAEPGGRILRPFFSSISDTPLWISIAVCFALTPVWGAAVGIRFHGAGTAFAILALLAANGLYIQLRPGPANPAVVMIETAAAFIAFTAVWAPLTYLSARSSHPLIDPALTRMDHLMGFDWDVWHGFVVGKPPFDLLLHIAYASLEPQTIAAIVFLPLVKGGRRGYALVRQGVVAIALTCALFWLFPALGAQKADWTADVLALRGDATLAFQLIDLKGIISFPSFHTVLGILFIYAFRGTRLGIIAIALNVLMIVSALSVGSHYLADIVSGVVVAAIAIALVEWLDEKTAKPARA